MNWTAWILDMHRAHAWFAPVAFFAAWFAFVIAIALALSAAYWMIEVTCLIRDDRMTKRCRARAERKADRRERKRRDRKRECAAAKRKTDEDAHELENEELVAAFEQTAEMDPWPASAPSAPR
jgi:hypothetical protein